MSPGTIHSRDDAWWRIYVSQRHARMFSRIEIVRRIHFRHPRSPNLNGNCSNRVLSAFVSTNLIPYGFLAFSILICWKVTLNL